ncbi:hypothetical protein GCM10023189_57550 [Nibrella saemangeumensis]|uniref:Lipoprotein n=2 Tax=Nibrella saemangeumensis TaxID=1084526 RepID=A0ABP8NQZ8_9BACT
MLVAIATLAVGCNSQRPYTGARTGSTDRYDERYDNRRNDGRRDDGLTMRDTRLERQLRRYENELNLTNRQKRELDNIVQKYERRGLNRDEQTYREAYRRLQQQKRQELLSVLTSRQRDTLRRLEERNRDYRDRDYRDRDYRRNRS